MARFPLAVLSCRWLLSLMSITSWRSTQSRQEVLRETESSGSPQQASAESPCQSRPGCWRGWKVDFSVFLPSWRRRVWWGGGLASWQAAHQGGSAAACRALLGKTPPVCEKPSLVGPAQFPRTFSHLHEHVIHPARHEADPGLVELGGA